ncbi:ABC transporter permease [Chitinimonas koreensis]|uniref:ABC transporter permease n=1 Tax=Chitinimonas koreensis TaxID=356302 RepID=UPI0004056C4E|nr:ABC transporter permease [Chitinimonas koreensis]QNM97442.1 ABC transporter permease [Chitinimonas koreensis]
MIRPNDLRIGWRQLWQDPGYSAVVILGLAIGIAVAFVLASFVEAELAVDRDPAAARLYQLELRYRNPDGAPSWQSQVPVPFRAEVDRAAPVAASSVLYRRAYSLRVGERVQRYVIGFVDPSFAAMLGATPQAGDLAEALARPDALALSSSTAVALFGRADVVGRSVNIQGRAYRVAAVLADRAPNSVFRFEVLASTRSAAWDNREFAYSEWGHHSGRLFVQLRPGADTAAAAALLQRLYDDAPRGEQVPDEFRLAGHVAEVRLMAVPRLKLDGAGSEGNAALYAGLAGLALLILLLAAINYVNLSTVRTLKRQREIGIRKALGASPGRIVAQFLTESVLVAALATALGLLLAWLCWPLLMESLGLRFAAPFGWPMLPLAVAAGLLTGLLAGLYPAWVACRVPVAQALAGRDRQETRGGLWLRRGLTVLQFGAAIGLSAFALVIFLQARYATRIDPGFATRPLLLVYSPSGLDPARSEQFRRALAQLPGVAAAGRSLDAPGRNDTSSATSVTLADGRLLNIRWEPVDPYFFLAYGLAPIAGRAFEPQRDTLSSLDRIVLNRSAVRQLGYVSPQAAVGQSLKVGDGYKQIVGVIEDIRYQSVREPAVPMFYAIGETWLYTITLRADGDPARVKAAAESLWRTRFPDETPQVEGFERMLENAYQNDMRLARLLSGAAAIATLIAGFGLYALAAYGVRRRAREIVIRKLYGAGAGAIAGLLGREFGALVLAGAGLGLPLAWLATQHYLDGFVDRAPIGVWPLAAALAAAALVALLATLRHMLTALAMPPVHALQG